MKGIVEILNKKNKKNMKNMKENMMMNMIKEMNSELSTHNIYIY